MTLSKRIQDLVKKTSLKLKIKSDEELLVRSGIERAMEKGLEINVAGKYFISSEQKNGRLYIPGNSNGTVYVTFLIELGAEKYPDIAKQWMENRQRLKELN